METLFDQGVNLHRRWVDYLCSKMENNESVEAYDSMDLVDILEQPEVGALLCQQQDLGQCEELVEQTQLFIGYFQQWFGY